MKAGFNRLQMPNKIQPPHNLAPLRGFFTDNLPATGLRPRGLSAYAAGMDPGSSPG